MACGKQWFNLIGAALSTIGAGLVTIGSWESTPQVTVRAGAITATLGGMSWTISGLWDLVDCLRAAGHEDQAALLQAHTEGLQQDFGTFTQILAQEEDLVEDGAIQ